MNGMGDTHDPWNPLFDLRQIMTPIRDCVSLSLGEIDLEALARLESADYGQAPVFDARRRVVGTIGTVAAREISNAARPLRARDLQRSGWPERMLLNALLRNMSESPAALVRRTGGTCVGLVTIYDLNRHEFRLAIYDLLARLEISLAHLLTSTFSEPWDWIENLTDESQAKIVGYWEVSKRADADIGPVVAMELSQLLDAVGSTEVLYNSLGFKGKRHAKQITGRIPNFRHQIMHPVRPLVLIPGDVASISAAAESVRDIARRVELLLK